MKSITVFKKSDYRMYISPNSRHLIFGISYPGSCYKDINNFYTFSEQEKEVFFMINPDIKKYLLEAAISWWQNLESPLDRAWYWINIGEVIDNVGVVFEY